MSRPAPTAAAAALILVAGLALSGCSILNNFTGGVTRDDDGNVTEGNDNADVFAIRVGDCVNNADLGEEVSSIPVVPCSEPHDSEAFFSHLMTDESYPGTASVQTSADEVCIGGFAGYVGGDYNSSALYVTYFYPTEASWAQGDREILCLVYDPDGPLTGSVKGSGR